MDLVLFRSLEKQIYIIIASIGNDYLWKIDLLATNYFTKPWKKYKKIENVQYMKCKNRLIIGNIQCLELNKWAYNWEYTVLEIEEQSNIQCSSLSSPQTSFSCVSFATLQSMTLKEAEEKLLIILKQVMEDKLSSTNVEARSTHNCSVLTSLYPVQTHSAVLHLLICY